VIELKNTIRINLHNRKSYQNEYNKEILSYELTNYILEEIKVIKHYQNIKFIITSDFEMSNKEKEKIVHMIRNSFGIDVGQIIEFSEKQILANSLLLVAGIIFLIMYYLLTLEILSEFILILGWVLLGEAICNFLYHGLENYYKIKRRKQIVNAKIVFE